MPHIRLCREAAGWGIQFIGPDGGDMWLYMGRSFDVTHRIQRYRASKDCGLAQIAFGSVIHHGFPARRTLGLTIAGPPK